MTARFGILRLQRMQKKRGAGQGMTAYGWFPRVSLARSALFFLVYVNISEDFFIIHFKILAKLGHIVYSYL